MNVAAWRRKQREALLAKRKSIPADIQRRADARVSELLMLGFPLLERFTIGFYWPFDGEVDPRVALHRFRTRGARTALPVVVARGSPLEYREWTPGVATVPGIYGLPVPQAPAVVPDVLVMPVVGFDAAGHRLGHGGGYFDRTLGSFARQPLTIGLAREADRIETVHPQPHDVPMDFVVTEAGIHEVTQAGLQVHDDLMAACKRAALLHESRRPLTFVELTTLLNVLLEAERAAAKAVATYLVQLALDSRGEAILLPVQRDESRNCAVLVALLRHIGAKPSSATGNFLQMALAVKGDRERIAFLNRGQAWVAQRLASALPRIADARVRAQLQEMHDSHLANIGACEALIEGEEPAR